MQPSQYELQNYPEAIIPYLTFKFQLGETFVHDWLKRLHLRPSILRTKLR
jgi:hypothetical protein